MNITPLCGVLALAALLPGAAFAAPNLAQPIASGQQAPPSVLFTLGTSKHLLVLKSEAEARAAGAHLLMDDGALSAFDFTREMLLLAVGSYNGGRVTISIELRRERFAIDPLTTGSRLTARIRTHSEISDQAMTTVTIRPFALVKAARSEEPIHAMVVPTSQNGPSFTSLERQTTEIGPMGTRRVEAISVLSDHRVLVRTLAGLAISRDYTGVATPDEWNALQRAVSISQVRDLPTAMVPGPHDYTLTTRFPDGTTGTVNSRVGLGGANLERVDRVLDQIRQRIQTTQLQGTVVARRTRQGPLRVWIDDNGSSTEVFPASTARQLALFSGRTVQLEGAPTANGFRVQRIVSPVREDVRGIISTDHSDVYMTPQFGSGGIGGLGGLGGFFTSSYKLFGPAARVASAADGQVVTIDAWTFLYSGNPLISTDVYVVGVRGTVTADSDLKTRRGRTVNSVKQGDRVLVTRINRRGTLARVSPSSGRSGAMPLNRLSLGEPAGTTITPGGGGMGIIGGLASPND